MNLNGPLNIQCNSFQENSNFTLYEKYFDTSPLITRNKMNIVLDLEVELHELKKISYTFEEFRNLFVNPVQDSILGKDSQEHKIKNLARVCGQLIIVVEMLPKFVDFASQIFNLPDGTDRRRVYQNTLSSLSTVLRALEEYLKANADAQAFNSYEELIKNESGLAVVVNSCYSKYAKFCNIAKQDTSQDSKVNLPIKISRLFLLVYENRASLVIVSQILAKIVVDDSIELQYRSLSEKFVRLSGKQKYLKNQIDITKRFWSENMKLLNHLENNEDPFRKLIILNSKDKKLFVPKWSSLSIGFILFNELFLKYSSDFLGNFITQITPLKVLWVEPSGSKCDLKYQLRIITPELNQVLQCNTEEDRNCWLRSINQATTESIGATQENTAEISLDFSRLLCPPTQRRGMYRFISDPLYAGAKYSGQWLNGQPHGKGILMWPDNKQYSGNFRHGLFHGLGKLVIPMPCTSIAGLKDIYEGEFANGVYNGEGQMIYANTDRYEGNWLHGKREGHGRFQYTINDGFNIYIGEWHADKRNGFGVESYTSIEKSFHGMWKDDVKEGYGFTITDSSDFCSGRFSNNLLLGRGFLINLKGYSFEGNIGAQMTLNGPGETRLPDGVIITGQFFGKWFDWANMGSEVKINNAQIQFQKQEKKPKKFIKMDWEENIIKYSANPEMKWRCLFEKCKEELHLSTVTKHRENSYIRRMSKESSEKKDLKKSFSTVEKSRPVMKIVKASDSIMRAKTPPPKESRILSEPPKSTPRVASGQRLSYHKNSIGDSGVSLTSPGQNNKNQYTTNLGDLRGVSSNILYPKFPSSNGIAIKPAKDVEYTNNSLALFPHNYTHPNSNVHIKSELFKTDKESLNEDYLIFHKIGARRAKSVDYGLHQGPLLSEGREKLSNQVFSLKNSRSTTPLLNDIICEDALYLSDGSQEALNELFILEDIKSPSPPRLINGNKKDLYPLRKCKSIDFTIGMTDFNENKNVNYDSNSLPRNMNAKKRVHSEQFNQADLVIEKIPFYQNSIKNLDKKSNSNDSGMLNSSINFTQIEISEFVDLSPNVDPMMIMSLNSKEGMFDKLKESLFNHFNEYCSTDRHPLGKLVKKLDEVMVECYAGIGASRYMLPHAINDVHTFQKKIAEIVRLYGPYAIQDQIKQYGIDANVLFKDSRFIDGYFVSDIFVPRVYHTLSTLFSLFHEKEDGEYNMILKLLSKMSCNDLMDFLSIPKPYPSSSWYKTASSILRTITSEHTIQGKLTVLEKSVNQMVADIKETKTELCTDAMIPYFQVVIVYAEIRKLSSELNLIHTFMDPKLAQGPFGFLLTLLEACYMMLLPNKLRDTM